MQNIQWSYPGSRWWKFDFHTHTPASHDTAWYKQDLVLTPEQWLLKYMAAGIDCVAVTDHNSGEWIDRLKIAYDGMKSKYDQGNPPDGFRLLSIFPGVEISVNGGFHLLAIFDPSGTSRTISDLLASVGYQGTNGDCDSVTRDSAEIVIEQIQRAGGISVPAHADRPGNEGKGLLAVSEIGSSSRLDPTTIKSILEAGNLLAVEWEDMSRDAPESVKKQVAGLAKVLGSDCHSFFKENAAPGSRYTWVKMKEPALEGLRLALLDGNSVSIRRSDEPDFDPFRVPTHIITAIEIENARYMGNGKKARLAFSPFFNAVVGGRGTGKSTLVHALRLVTQRECELRALGQGNEVEAQFDAFRKVANGRDDKGALRDNTLIRLEWQREKTLNQLVWKGKDTGFVVNEWRDEQWLQSSSQSVNVERFPLRILSQGQIASLAGSGRQTLLSIIDEAAKIEPLKQAFEEAKRTFFTQRTRLRELEAKLTGQPEVIRKLEESSKKLSALTQANPSVRQAYMQARQQVGVVQDLFAQLKSGAIRISEVSEQIALDDWPSQYFAQHDEDVLAWRRDIDLKIKQIHDQLLLHAKELNAMTDVLQVDERYEQWWMRAQGAKQAWLNQQEQLKLQGVDDSQALERLTTEHQQLESQNKALNNMQNDRQNLLRQIEAQRVLLVQKRKDITQERQRFIKQALSENPHVRMEVVHLGFDAHQIEQELRELLDVTDERFANDILVIENEKPLGGLAFELAQADENKKSEVLDAVKQRILVADNTLSGYFRNYLKRKLEKPEFSDYVLVWFPEDDLKIEYNRDKRWTSISQGSQGQRSAALLAFLLAFGEEPIVLDQPEDDLDNHLIYELIVSQIRENKLRRQLIIVTHNPNVVVNGDAELVHVMEFGNGQCFLKQSGALQEKEVREEVCRVMEGGHEAFSRRWKRLGREV